MNDRVYLDHNATSPLRPEAAEAIRSCNASVHGNPSSLHAEGRAARAVLEEAREKVAALTGLPTASVVFTSGGSEAIEAVVRGVCDRAPAHIRRIVISAVEHTAVLEAVRAMERKGFHVEEIPCDRDGRVDPERFGEKLRMHTALAALQWANNETGVIQPVDEVGAVCRKTKVPFLVDAVQVAGKLPMDGRSTCADFLALSAHKLGGPQGIGAMTVREGFVLAPLVHGGNQERRRRGGTEAVALAAGFGAAAAAAADNLKEETGRMLRLRAMIETRLHERFDDVRFHGQAAGRLPNTVNFAIRGLRAETLVISLDMRGIAVSTGSACSSGEARPSRVLQAMGYSEAEAAGAVRVSVGWNTTAADVDRFVAELPEVVERARRGA
jgi:cysteine desulfurase